MSVFESLIQQYKAESIKRMEAVNDAAPIPRLFAEIERILFNIDSSSEILGTFSGVRGIAYPYKLPSRYTRASLVMREIYYPFFVSHDRLEWMIACSLMEKATPEQKREHGDAFQRIAESSAKPILELISEISALNPQAGLEKISYRPTDYFDTCSVLMGICCLFHPDDIKYFMEVRGFNSEARRNPQADDLAISDPVVKAVFNFASTFGIRNGYIPSPATIQRLKNSLARQGLPLDTESTPSALRKKLERNLSRSTPGALTRIYFASWAASHRQIADTHAKKNRKPKDINTDITKIIEFQKHFEKFLFRIMRQKGLIKAVEREIKDITDALKEAHLSENVCSLLEKKWLSDVKRTAAKSFIFVAAGLTGLLAAGNTSSYATGLAKKETGDLYAQAPSVDPVLNITDKNNRRYQVVCKHLNA